MKRNRKKTITIVLAGSRLNGSASQDTVMEWINGLELDL